MKTKNIILSFLAVPALLVTGCVGDLDQYPHTELTSHDVYSSVDGYQSVISGVYTAMLLNQSSIDDEDTRQNFTRCLLMFQECSTDLLDDVWLAGESMTDVNNQSWNAGDPWVGAIYYHIYNIVSMANEFIRNASDESISSFPEPDRTRIKAWRDEARGLRAIAYFWAMDLFPGIPFVTEDDPVGSYIPETYTRAQVFSFLESELQDIGGTLPQTSYGHVNRATAWTLLARMYLNAERYIGEPRYDECIRYCDMVMGDGYSLESDYFKLFNADNHLRSNEIIFTLATDAIYTVAWGAGTYLVCATRFDNYDGMYEDFGVSTYWNCLRARPQLVDLFDTDGDHRAMFGDKDRRNFDTPDLSDDYYEIEGDAQYKYRDRSKEIIGHDETTSGWLINKWTNVTDNGEVPSDTRVNGAETDFPVFRLADVYLMYAEAVLRGGNGSASTALDLVNDVRRRAFGGSSDGEISSSDLTLDFILAERGRELYTEGIRRTDLIRFGKYTSGYQWNWKGGVRDGADVDGKFEYLPIPEAELSANPDLKALNTQIGF